MTDNLEEALNDLNKFKDVVLPHGLSLERVQIDINDTTYFDVMTIEPEDLVGIKCEQKLDFHLMVNEPVGWVDDCVKADAERVIGQIEHMKSQSDFVEKVLKWGIKPGLAVDFGTDLTLVEQNLFNSINVILLMSYPAGKGGQPLDERVYDKIEQLKKIRSEGNHNFLICLDGGVTLDNVKRVRLAGVDEAAVGLRVVGGDIEKNLENYFQKMY